MSGDRDDAFGVGGNLSDTTQGEHETPDNENRVSDVEDSLGPRPIRHGTRDGYNNQGCRCDACRGAQNAYMRAYKRERRRSLGRGMVSAERSRSHIARLMRLGINAAAIADKSGVARSSVVRIFTGETLEVIGATERALLRCPPVAGAYPSFTVPSDGAASRIARLRAAGFSFSAIERASGVTHGHVKAIAEGRYQTITRATHDALLAVRVPSDRKNARLELAHTVDALVRDQIDTSWMNAGKCRGGGQEPFYPDPSMSRAEGQAICEECPVRLECLAYALATRERYGVWGGMTPSQRKKLAPRRREALVGHLRVVRACVRCAKPVAVNLMGSTVRLYCSDTCRKHHDRTPLGVSWAS